MAKYRYIGPGPIEVISGGELVKPLDVREFDAPPAWGLWDLIEEEEHGAAGTQTGLEADAQAGTPDPTPAAAAVPAVPLTPKGM